MSNNLSFAVPTAPTEPKKATVTYRFISEHPDPVREAEIIKSLCCTGCDQIKPHFVKMSLIAVPSIKWKLCKACTLDLDRPGFDWDAWKVER